MTHMGDHSKRVLRLEPCLRARQGMMIDDWWTSKENIGKWSWILESEAMDASLE